MPVLHYIAMAGLHGYMPNYCEVSPTYQQAVDSLISLHELGRIRAKRLKDDGYLELSLYGGQWPGDEGDGNEYCEVTECNCDEPWVHQDGYNKDAWLSQYAEEYGLEVTE